MRNKFVRIILFFLFGVWGGVVGQRTFIINACVRNMSDFGKLVEAAGKIKPFGRVQINISSLADKDLGSLPKENSPWHEYASYNPTPFKFFPDARIVPYIDAEFVRENRQLLLQKAAMLRRNGMDAAFFGYEPTYLPAAFFDAYPGLMGPRVDHPRRSNQKEFAPCVSMPGTQEMYAHMMEQLLKSAPEIKTFYFKTNDAGTGICWADWLYSGPNGPAYCKGRTTGQRVEELLDAFKKGAQRAGRTIDIYLSEASSNFSDSEKLDIQRHLPSGCFYKNTEAHEMSSISSSIVGTYPVRGIIDPVAVLREADEMLRKDGKFVFINLRAWYDRGDENGDATDLLFSVLAEKLKHPGTVTGGPLADLRVLCEAWAGPGAAGQLYHAFVELHDAFTFKSRVCPGVSPLNWDVALRLVNRPLVIEPRRLSGREERYFLPWVFNVSEKEARDDYMDMQGIRVTASRDSLLALVARIQDAAKDFGDIDPAAPKHAYLEKLALSLRLYASLMRSCANFAGAQAIRDRDSVKLSAGIHRPGKEPTWKGDEDFIPFVDIMRDELDNTAVLIDLLQKGGAGQLCLAKDAAHEDTFLLGPGLPGQVRQKRKIMLDHWTDIEDYMASPFK